MKVPVSQLQEGCVVARDVYLKTLDPLIKENTVLTNDDIEFLQTFLVPEVEVHRLKDDGTSFTPMVEQPKKKFTNNQTSSLFQKLFCQTIDRYDHIFYDFKNGGEPDLHVLRPLVDRCLKEAVRQPKEIFFIGCHLDQPKSYVPAHAVAVAMLSSYLAHKLGYDTVKCKEIGYAGLFGDFGMAKVPDYLLKKNTSLLPSERQLIQQHPLISYQVLRKDASFSEDIRLATFQHHERLDGSGYPLQLADSQLHPYGKIIAVADVYLALTADRNYRRGLTPYHAVGGMLRQKYGALDTKTIQILLQSLMDYSIGTRVRLSDGSLAEIIYVDEKTLLTPLVRMVETDKIFPLNQKDGLTIQSLS
ncbi:HD-GYP domain-containing protein [Bacillaceae bacterium SIJ1]|uniref:HD-GYP domain-containing protein n=1 Tax=Litoribacterium kuwaitense TaxID=1398745 RepID=UPI0013EA0967|nr:HD-GYP domain-containing protein [Litoribacterium kuwaitense]NGP45190.1 HD-GYP domain-containing protein [Litoribacterium kuwaitense]